jgi:peptidyl-prolyl cis-trans isomerase C
MKTKCKLFGVLFAAVCLALPAPGAADKTAATNAPAAPGAAPKIEDLFPDTVVARGRGFEIKRSQLDEAMSGMRSTVIARGQQVTPADNPEIEKKSFDHLLEVQLLNGKATDEDKTKGAALADKRLDMIRKQAVSEDALAKQLKTMNLTVDSLRARLAEESTAEQVLRDKVTVTDADIKKFFDDNPSLFEEPEMIHGYHILIITVDKTTGAQLSDDDKKAKNKIADGLLKRINDKEDFSKLARDFSDDPGAKENGGEFTLPRGRMPLEFASAAFSLQTNQVSDVVTSQLGYHIIKLVEKLPAKKLEFAKVSPDIREHLETLEMGKILPDVSAKLQKEADVQILDEELKKIEEAAAAEAPKPAPSAKGIP